MSDQVAIAMALGFILLACLVAAFLLLSPWLRLQSNPQACTASPSHDPVTAAGEGIPVLS